MFLRVGNIVAPSAPGIKQVRALSGGLVELATVHDALYGGHLGVTNRKVVVERRSVLANAPGPAQVLGERNRLPVMVHQDGGAGPGQDRYRTVGSG